jgi:hypothetical protein
MSARLLSLPLSLPSPRCSVLSSSQIHLEAADHSDELLLGTRSHSAVIKDVRAVLEKMDAVRSVSSRTSQLLSPLAHLFLLTA